MEIIITKTKRCSSGYQGEIVVKEGKKTKRKIYDCEIFKTRKEALIIAEQMINEYLNGEYNN